MAGRVKVEDENGATTVKFEEELLVKVEDRDNFATVNVKLEDEESTMSVKVEEVACVLSDDEHKLEGIVILQTLCTITSINC